jgi:hypothetical protein
MKISNAIEDLVIEENAELEKLITGEHFANYFVLIAITQL